MTTETPESAASIIEMLEEAAAANHATPGREGNVVRLSTEIADECIITADLHGHRENFDKLLKIADLENNPRRHLIMQEVCHGGPTYPQGSGCMSHVMLEDVAELKTQFPDRFHFLLSNHELAELTDYPIVKARKMLNLLFRCGVQQRYGDEAEQVRNAYTAFLGSLPLAARLENGIFISHSLPERVDLDGFDSGVFDRPIEADDLSEGGAVFRLVWGRDFRPANAQAFAELVDAKVLVHGHEPCAEGYLLPNDRQIILDCCGENACYLPAPVGGDIDHAQAVELIQRLK